MLKIKKEEELFNEPRLIPHNFYHCGLKDSEGQSGKIDSTFRT